MITAALRAHLLTVSAVTALVSTRIRLEKMVQSEPIWPVLRLHLIDRFGGMHLRGSAGIKRARVQVDALYMEVSGLNVHTLAWALSAAVEGPGDGTGLLGFTGDIGSPAVHIHAITDGGARSGYDPHELKQFKVMHDYIVDFSE